MEMLSFYRAADPDKWLHRIGEAGWEAGRYLYRLLREDRFRALYGEKAEVLLLTDGDRLAAFCTYAEKDDIPETGLAPWIGFVYTFPEYRGQRLAGKLIRGAKESARRDGYDSLYISTGETGLYEKYGAAFLAVMKDRRGEDSRVYRLDSRGFAGWETADAPAVTADYPGIRTPKDLYDALWYVWSAETCAPRMRGDWSADNRTLGQCSVTAFLAQDIFGGKVYGIPLEDGSFHCYNRAGGRTFDLTSEQFGGRCFSYTGHPEQLRGEHFRKEEKRLRYEQLKEGLRAYCGGVAVDNPAGRFVK